MLTSLRAFLMLRSPTGEWDVQVSHSLEEVVTAWSQLEDAEKTAVLHVGFERRVARSFEQIALEFPGKVLLTPAAKFALPPQFTSSGKPVGAVNEEAVFLALQGWGYSEPEPLNLRVQATAQFSGWIATFVTTNPQHGEALEEVGLFDDESYLQNEHLLSPELRLDLGQARTSYLIGEVKNDPTAIARAAPPWLAKQKLDELDLTVRIGNVFKSQSLVVVSDIGRYVVSDLLTMPNFGRTSVHQLVEILLRALAAGPRPSHMELASAATSGCLLDAVYRSLESCSDRERDILTRRMGLDCAQETLAEIGETYGITRERIRQIEAKVVDRLLRRETWDDVLAAKLHNLLADREYPLPLIGAEAVDNWFSGVAAHRTAIKYLFENMCEAPVNLVDIDGIEYLSFLSQDAWQEMVGTARQLLASGIDRDWTEDDCQHYVKLLVPAEAREFSTLLWDIASKWCHFAESDGRRTLISYGRGVDQLIEAILSESEVPLHYSEIATRASTRGGREIDERRAHNAASEVGYLFGSGLYGALKHISVARDIWESLAEEAAEIVAEGPDGRQWHASELLETLAERGVRVPNGFDKYQLDIALKEADQLYSLGRMVWVLNPTASDAARVDVHQAIVSVLKSAGGPLKTSELRQRLVAVRGLNQGMQFHVVDPLIKLDAQTWGLNDRDISIKRSEQPAFLASVIAKLQTMSAPVHISECAEVFGDLIPPRALFCLASGSDGILTTTDRCLRVP